MAETLEMTLADNVRESVNFDSVLKKGDKVQKLSAKYASAIMFNEDTAGRAAAITQLQGEIVQHFDQVVIPAATQLGREQAKRVVREIGGGVAPASLEDADLRRRILFEGTAKPAERLRIVQRLVNDAGNTLENRLGAYWLEPGRDAKAKLEQLRRMHEDGESRRQQYEQRLAKWNQAGEGRRPAAPRLEFLSKFTAEATNSVRVQGRRVGTDAEHTEFQKQGFQVFTWVTVNAGDACPDCRRRQGTTGTMKYFDSIGRPGSGATVCGSGCFCILVPKETIYHAPGLARGVEVPGERKPDPVITPPEDQKKIDDQIIKPPPVAATPKDPKQTVKDAIEADEESAAIIKKFAKIQEKTARDVDKLQAKHAAAEATREQKARAYMDAYGTADAPRLRQEWEAAKAERDAIEKKFSKLGEVEKRAAHKAIEVEPAERFGFVKDIPVTDQGYAAARYRTAATKAAVTQANAFVQSVAKRPPEFTTTLPDLSYAVLELPAGGRASMQSLTRGDASGPFGLMRLSPTDGADVAVHELGHELEARLPGAHEAAKAFLALRTEGQRVSQLAKVYPNSAYRPDEIARDDEFKKAFGEHAGWYVGKDYGDKPYTEILSMGLQKMYENPLAFAELDPQYFRFVLGVLHGRIQL